ncbi:MAG: cation:proton antiporter [Bacteriovoracaceae bacterium]
MASNITETASVLSATVPLMGLALAAALAVGKLASKFQVPKVTGFILVGILLGPTGANLITAKIAHNLEFINQIAFGLILFNIGGVFNREIFQSVGRKQVKFSLVLGLFIWISTFLICSIFGYLNYGTWYQAFVLAGFLAIVAIDPAPPTSLLVIKEVDGKGPLTQSIFIFLVVSTLLGITVSELTVIGYQSMEIWPSEVQATLTTRLTDLGISFLGSILAGIGLGFILSYWEQKEKNQYEILLGVVTTLMLGQTLAHYFNLNAMLISLTLGFIIINISNTGNAIHSAIKGMGLSIYALFFVLAGAHIDLTTQLASLGIASLGYVLARFIGIPFSSILAARIVGESKELGMRKGLSVLSHAGLAMAMVLNLKPIDDKIAKDIIGIVMSSIFIFEIAGPLLLRFSIMKANEADILSGKDITSKATITFKDLFRNLLFNLHIIKPKSTSHINSIRHLIKRDIIAIQENATPKEIANFVKTHHAFMYAIVDEEHKYKGILDISALHQSLNDSDEFQFVKAKDLIGPTYLIKENVKYHEALQIFEQLGVTELPVVNCDTRDLVGSIHHKDVVVANSTQKPANVKTSEYQVSSYFDD